MKNNRELHVPALSMKIQPEGHVSNNRVTKHDVDSSSVNAYYHMLFANSRKIYSYYMYYLGVEEIVCFWERLLRPNNILFTPE